MIHDKYDEQMNIIISGVESDTYWKIVVDKCGMKTVLMSYHYLQKKPKDFLAKRLKKHPDVKIFIDSGAHTFLANMDNWVEKPDSFWEEYLENYTNFIRDNKEHIFACADLDIDDLVGTDKVDQWRKDYFEPLEEEGVQVCYIWHSIRGEQGWEDMCRKYSYTGFSMMNDATATVPRLMKRINVAKKYNTRVHGMALTKTEILVRVPFFSADSSVDGKSSILVKDLRNDRTYRTTIEELYNQNIEEEFRTTDYETRVPYDDFQVLTLDDNKKVIWGDLYGVVKHKVKKPTVRLKVESGKDIICTTDHSIITMDKEGNLKETSANELKVGDYVMSPKSYDIKNELVPFTNVLIDKPNSQLGRKEWQVVEVSDKFLNFLGLWIGDGHFSKDTTGLSCYQDKECREVIDYIANLYNAKVSVDKNGVDARMSNVRLQRVMKALGFEGNSRTKRIPKFIYSLSEQQICQFLKGFFSANNTNCLYSYSVTSKELKEDLVELLTMLGINVTTSCAEPTPHSINREQEVSPKVWHLSIVDKRSKLIFKEKIGFLQSYKNSKLLESSITTEGVLNGSVRQAEVVFLEIKDIETINDGTKEVEVYDLSVRKYERFFANGILVHNTTWLVGQQYGELNWFDGRKMKRMLKKEWQRGLKTKLLKEPFNADWDKLMNGMGGRGDTYELLRLNVIAYRLAEEHIRKRLGTKQYWMPLGANQSDSKPKTRQRVVQKTETPTRANKPQKSSVPSILKDFNSDNSTGLPSAEWFEGECNDWIHYCEVCGIDADNYSKEEAVSLIHDFYVFLEEPSLADNLEDSDLIEYAQELSGENISDRDDAIKELTQIYNQNLLGERKDFSEENEIQDSYKERNRYITDDDFITIDLSENDIDTQFALPAPESDDMPEITAYDKELRMLNIEPVRDSKGRFVKGHQKVRKPKSVYSEKYPKLVCNTCYKSGDCPQYKAGYVCAYDRALKKFDTRNLDDIMDAMQSMTNVNLQRMQRALMFETMDGGMPTPEVTGLIDQNMRLLQKMKELQDHSPKAVLSQRRIVNADGTQEVETQMHMNPQGGILSQIFGASEDKKKDEKVVDAEIVE